MSIKSRFLDLIGVQPKPQLQVRHTQPMMMVPRGAAAEFARHMSKIMAEGRGTHRLHELPAKPQGVLRGVLADYAARNHCGTEDLVWRIDRKMAVHVKVMPRIEVPS
jgi:hypothetical protein